MTRLLLSIVSLIVSGVVMALLVHGFFVDPMQKAVAALFCTATAFVVPYYLVIRRWIPK